MRKGMMVGSGKKGYHNVVGRDPAIHSQSAKGIKQPEQINIFPNFSPAKINESSSEKERFAKELKKREEKIGNDLKDDINNNIDDIAIDHLKTWESRYNGKSKSDVREDLFINHDNDSEVEREEHHLGRKLNEKEREFYISNFIKAVVKNKSR